MVGLLAVIARDPDRGGAPGIGGSHPALAFACFLAVLVHPIEAWLSERLLAGCPLQPIAILMQGGDETSPERARTSAGLLSFIGRSRHKGAGRRRRR